MDVLPAGPVALAGDDGDHLVLCRVVGVGDRADRLSQDRVGLGVGGDEDGMDDASRIEAAGPDGKRQAALPPVLLHLAFHLTIGPPDAEHHRTGSDEPIDVDHEDRGRDIGREDEGRHHRGDQDRPGQSARGHLEDALDAPLAPRQGCSSCHLFLP